MDAQGTMRLMFDTMDAYDRADFDRLAEIYAEDAHWLNANPKGPHCHNRKDIFAMFRQRKASGIRVGFDELRSTPTEVVLTARAADFGRVVSVFSFQDAALWRSRTNPQWRPPKQRSSGKAQRQPTAGGTGGGFDGDPVGRLIDGGGQRSSDAALVASRSLSPITVAPELSGRGAVGPQVASRLNSRKKS